MENSVYDDLFIYLSDNTIPLSIIEKNCRFAIKNFKSMAKSYMVKEGSIYKVCFSEKFTITNCTKIL